ncbi:MAG: hypothetical protein ABMA64_33045 [Myxococcota bacterium]
MGGGPDQLRAPAVTQAPAPAPATVAPPGADLQPQGNAAAIADVVYQPTDADIGWIDSLDATIKDQIDAAFSDADLRKSAQKANKRKPNEDKQAYDTRIQGIVDEKMKVETKANKPKGQLEALDDRVYTGVDRATGRDLARKDFVATAVAVLGSVDEAKRWYQAIGRSNAPGGTLLHESARRRYEDARVDFRAEHPGWDFETSHVGFQGRSRQHARNSMGMLSHFLGLALDVVAVDNPHLVAADQRVLAETTGADAMGPGTAHLALQRPDGKEYDYTAIRKQIAALGNANAEGKAPSAEGQRLVGPELDRAWEHYAGTERRMQGSLDRDGDGAKDEIAELRKVAEQYWASRGEIKKRRAALAAAEDQRKRSIAAARDAVVKAKEGELKAAIDAHLLAENRTDRLSRKEIAADPALAKLQAEADHLRKHKAKIGADQYGSTPVWTAAEAAVADRRRELDAVEGPIRSAKDQLLAPWFAKFDERLAGYGAIAAAGDPSQLKGLDQALGKLARAGRHPEATLDKLAADPALAPLLKGIDPTDAAAVKSALEQARDRAKASKGAAGNADVVRKTRGKLDDLDWVFGAEDALKFSDPTALQLAERGFIWEGEKSAGHPGLPVDQGDPKDQWMKAFTKTMMEHGFAPGGQWGQPDGMHFELVDEMGRLGAGGKSWGPKGER